MSGTETYQELVPVIEEAITEICSVQRLAHWNKELTSLQDRLVRQEHTIAVFGAFSAGKSSLLNALLARQALAVSPNPTTAAVTHLYADTEKDDGSGIVYVKSREQMWDDIKQAFLTIRKAPTDFEVAISMAKSLKMADFSANSRKAVSFLLAAAKGYEKMGDLLGTHFPIQASEVRTYTAIEQYACFVQRVDIVQNTGLPGEGFVLVDTPGVDSIHKRHTDVAFEYMRKADAVIFVLYYTHAFSRADKEFLLQLAGVQDVAGADKLFVVINAVDLAKSDDEKAAVRERVEDELRQVGIRKPRVFEVSSQLSFAADSLRKSPQSEQFERLVRLRLHLSDNDLIPTLESLAEMSGVPKFIQNLQSFVVEQSDVLMHQSVFRTFHAINQQIIDECNRLELLVNQDDERILLMKQIYAKLADGWRDLGQEFGDGLAKEESGLRKDWEELVFHAGERCRFRLSGLFREAFHPGQFRAGVDLKRQLNEAARDFVQSLEHLIEIETRTLSLRIDQSVLHMVNHLRDEMKKSVLEMNVPMIHYDVTKRNDFNHEEGIFRAEIPLELVAAGYRHFSSAKHFFEEDGASDMFHAIEESVISKVRQELQRLASGATDVALSSMRKFVHDELFTAAEFALSDGAVESAKDSKQTLSDFCKLKEWFERHLSSAKLSIL
jgi:GTPase SAR1 family protein